MEAHSPGFGPRHHVISFHPVGYCPNFFLLLRVHRRVKPHKLMNVSSYKLIISLITEWPVLMSDYSFMRGLKKLVG